MEEKIDLAMQAPYYFYNYKGEKVYLSLNTKYAFLSIKEQVLSSGIRQRNIKVEELQSDGIESRQFMEKQIISRFFTRLSFEEEMSESEYLTLLSDIRLQNQDIIISPFFKLKNDDVIGLSNFFYVKLKESGDSILLMQMAEQTKTVIVEQDAFMPLWYILSTTEASELNAMETANLFYESGLFSAAEPNFMVDIFNCVNDEFFHRQWGLRNIGHPGIDINACNAWQVSTGRNVTVAVIDQGVMLNHPDFETNTQGVPSFDSESRTSPQQLRGSHGTPCAGIIGAISNNFIGVAGVAPNCRLMSISNSLMGVGVLQQRNLAAAINWAWDDGGADVISNSWSHNLLQGAYITNAINNAVTQGRNRRGCVVVFSVGNDNSQVNYPASLPNVIAVGAINRNGQRNVFSNFGITLDVVAPGEANGVFTTNWQGGYSYFGYTSAACPHVAGIAALILSVAPGLTAQQVRNAIETTCNKNLSGFFAIQNRPNGTWNTHLGYGLVDAHAAVVAAIIPGPAIIEAPCQVTYTANLPVGSTNVQWSVGAGLTIVSSTPTSCIVRRANNTVQNSTISCTYTHNGQTFTITRNITVRQIRPTALELVEANTHHAVVRGVIDRPYYFRALMPAALRPHMLEYRWELDMFGDLPHIMEFWGENTHHDPVTFHHPDMYPLRLMVRDACGWSRAMEQMIEIREW